MIYLLLYFHSANSPSTSIFSRSAAEYHSSKSRVSHKSTECIEFDSLNVHKLHISKSVDISLLSRNRKEKFLLVEEDELKANSSSKIPSYDDIQSSSDTQNKHLSLISQSEIKVQTRNISNDQNIGGLHSPMILKRNIEYLNSNSITSATTVTTSASISQISGSSLFPMRKRKRIIRKMQQLYTKKKLEMKEKCLKNATEISSRSWTWNIFIKQQSVYCLMGILSAIAQTFLNLSLFYLCMYCVIFLC